MLMVCITLDNALKYVLWIILTLKGEEWALMCYGAMVTDRLEDEFQCDKQR